MAKTQKAAEPWIRTALRRAARVHIYYVLAYALSLIIFDSWNLITHEGIARKWTIAVVLMIVSVAVWFISKQAIKYTPVYTLAIVALIIADIVFAAYNVSWERGMASKSLLFFIVPIATAALTRSRSILLAATALSTAVYSMVVVRYFHLHYGEGFRIQVYGELFLFGFVFFVIAWLMRILQREES
jgi:hypothetical protein